MITFTIYLILDTGEKIKKREFRLNPAKILMLPFDATMLELCYH